MRLAKKILSLSLLAAPCLWSQASQAAACSGPIGQVQSVSLDAQRSTMINYVANPDAPGTPGPGRFDPVPLLQTSIIVPAGDVTEGAPPKSCLVVHFSAQAYSLDNGIVFQALVDGKPMKGNAPNGPNTTPNPAVFQATPIIYDNSNTEVGRAHGQFDMLSYTFVAPVGAGKHTVKILFANCCSAFDATVPGDAVQAATLTLEAK